MSDMCDYPGCTAPIINGVPICHHRQTYDRATRRRWRRRVTTLTRCDQWSCRTTVDLDDDPAALQACGHVVCDKCVTCDQCPEVAA